jgi:hypothetical protein
VKFIVGIVTLGAFAGIVVAAGHWIGNLEASERTALAVSFCVLLGASITLAVVSRGARRRRRQEKGTRRRTEGARPVEQGAQGQGNAQANDHSTSVSGPGDQVQSPTTTSTTDSGNSGSGNTNSGNSNSGNSGSTIITTGGSACGVQDGSSGPARVSDNTSGGSATSGDVTEVNEGEGCNVQVGSSGSATVSENGEGGNATSGSVEERNG